jgi:predicted sulfurtransferase
VEGGVVKYVNTFNDGNWLGNLYTFDDRVSAFVGDKSTHTTIGVCLHSDKYTDNCENCRNTECNARLIVDKKEHEKHMGFCSEECFKQSLKTLLIKDVDWDALQIKKEKLKKKNEDITYKEIRSMIKAGKMSFQDAQKII